MTAAEHLTDTRADLRLVPVRDPHVITLPYHATRRSPLNPRKTFDHDALVELAVNIYERTPRDDAGTITGTGIMQNLMGRPDALNPAGVEIAAGERRQRAVGLLVDGLTVRVKTGEDANGRPIMGEAFYQVPGDYPLPFRIEEMTDAELIEAATVENIQRQDMTPMEEADAYLSLVSAGRTLDYIAVRYGKHPNTVRNRVELAAGLGQEGRKLLDAGEITLEHAKLIASTTGALKKSLTEQAKNGASVSTLKHMLRAGEFPVSNAIFDVEASGLRIDEGGLLGDFPARFTDRKAALSRQVQALEAVKADEEKTGSWGKVEILPVESEYANLPHAEWVTRPAGMKPHLTLIYSTTTGKTARSDLYVRIADARTYRKQVEEEEARNRASHQDAQASREGETSGTVTPHSASSLSVPPTAPKIREAAHEIAHRARAQAIQGKLATDPQRCLALACHALIQSAMYHGHNKLLDVSVGSRKDVPLTEEGRALADDVLRTFGTIFAQDDKGRVTCRNLDVDVLDELTAPQITGDDLLKLFAFLTHRHAGNWDQNQGSIPSRVSTLARKLNVQDDVNARFTLSAEYLNAYTAQGLGGLIESMPAKLRPVGTVNVSKNELVGLIMEKAPALREAGWVPDLVKFR